jgi:hypothetical protein
MSSFNFVLTHEQQLRSWYYSEVLQNLSKGNKIVLYLPSDLQKQPSLEPDGSLVVKFWDVSEFDNNSIVNYLNLNKHRKNKSFRNKIVKEIYDEKIATNHISKTFLFLLAIKRKPRLFLTRNRYFFNKYFRKHMRNTLKFTPPISAEKNIWYVVVSISDQKTTEILNTLELLRLPVVQIIENWDNPSSKLCINNSPMAVLVWSEQMKKHVSEIHHYPPGKIFVMGSARFPTKHEIHLASKPKLSSKVRLQVFYAGFFSECVDRTKIVNLYDALDASIDGETFTLVVRPHPMMFDFVSSELINLEGRKIELDFTEEDSNNKTKWPTTNAAMYQAMLNSDIVIGSPTTILLEAIMFNKRIIIDLTGCETHFNSSEMYFKNYEHFDEIIACEAIRKFSSYDELSKIFESEFDEEQYRKDISDLRNYLIKLNEISYESDFIETHQALSRML